MAKISKTKWAYVAAMLDGEGHVSITRHLQSYGKKGKKYWLVDCKIGISNVSVPLMDWIKENFGGDYKDGKQGSNRPCYRWNLDQYHLQEKFLLGILPYLVIKRKQALLALEFVRMKNVKNPKRRLEISKECMALNKGESPTTNTLDFSYGLLQGNKSLVEPLNPFEKKIESELDSDTESAPVVKQGVKNPLSGLSL
jgi:hypothetical protein